MTVPAVVGFIAVAVSGLISMEDPQRRIWAAGLLVAFGVFFFFLPEYQPFGPRTWHLRLGLLTVVGGALTTIQPGWGIFPILFFMTSPMAISHFPNRAGVAWVGVFTLVTAAIFIANTGFGGLIQLLPYMAGYIFFAAFGWTTVQAMRDRQRSEQLLAELQQVHAQLQDYAARLEEMTITQERNRIAREMHDTLGHRLTISSVQLEGAQRLVRSNPERAEQILGTVREQIREGLGELRRTVAMLRASVEEDLPLEQALPRLAGQIQEATGMHINLSLEGCPEALPAPYRQALYRAAQEGLTNIQRHAQASEVWLRLEQRDEQITLLLSDNGVGFPAEQAPGGFGLTGLKERAAMLGGDFFLDPRPGGGAQLTFRLPFPPVPGKTQETHLDDKLCDC